MTTSIKPIEFIRNLKPGEKKAALLELLKEEVKTHGDIGLLTIHDPEGGSFGYFIPPKTAQEHFRKLAPQLTPEQRQVTLAALSSPDQTFDMKQYLDQLNLEDALPN